MLRNRWSLGLVVMALLAGGGVAAEPAKPVRTKDVIYGRRG